MSVAIVKVSIVLIWAIQMANWNMYNCLEHKLRDDRHGRTTLYTAAFGCPASSMHDKASSQHLWLGSFFTTGRKLDPLGTMASLSGYERQTVVVGIGWVREGCELLGRSNYGSWWCRTISEHQGINFLNFHYLMSSISFCSSFNSQQFDLNTNTLNRRSWIRA